MQGTSETRQHDAECVCGPCLRLFLATLPKRWSEAAPRSSGARSHGPGCYSNGCREPDCRANATAAKAAQRARRRAQAG